MAGRNSEVRVAIVADNSSLSSNLKDSQSKLAGFGRAVGKIALAAGAAAAVGLAALGKASIEAASSAQQSLGGTQAVFGKFADQVIKDSNRAALAVGLSADEYRSSANIIGSLLRNQGVAQDKLRGSTKDLITTSADLAATYGGETKDAVDALASAFKGEFDPLQNYGITLKQSVINTEALRVAHVKSTAEFNKLSNAVQTAAKRQATSNLITKQATIAQGQFRKQSQTLAEQQQMLGAQWDNLKVKIGNALLPVVTHLFQVMNKDLMPALAKLARRYLPEVRKALDGWAKSGSPQEMMAALGDTLEGIEWGDIGDGLADIGDSLKQLLPMLGQVSVDTVADGFTVFGLALKFAADHASTLAKILPALVAAFALYKAAQLLNNVAGKDSVAGLILQIAQTRQLTVANRELAASLTTLNANLGGTTTNAAKATGGIKAMGAMARGAAGLAGVGLLAAGATETNDTLSTLESTAGGAAAGFAVGGPWGAAIGGAAGLMFGLAKNTRGAAKAAEVAVPSWDALRDALDQVTGAQTDASRAMIFDELQRNGTIKSLQGYGLSARTVVAAVAGEGEARRKVLGVLKESQAIYDQEGARIDTLARRYDVLNGKLAADTTATQEQREAWGKQRDAIGELLPKLQQDRATRQGVIDTIRSGIGIANKDAATIRQRTKAVTDFTGKLKGIPKQARTDIKANGVLPTTKAIAELARRYRLTPKQVKTLIVATGTETTVRKVEALRAKLRDTGKTKADLSTFRRSFDEQIGGMRQPGANAAEAVGRSMREGLKKGAKPDLAGFKAGVTSGASSAKSAAYTGGLGVGSSLKSGTLAGVGGLGTSLSAAMSSAVSQGIAAARAAARAQSPSKETEQLGKDLTRGLVLGVQRGSSGVSAALSRLTERVNHTLAHQLEQRQAAIRKRLKGKPETKALHALSKAWAQHSKAVTKATADERKALLGLGKAQDKVAAQLENAKGKLAELTQASRDYATGIRDSFVAFGDITQLGISEDSGGVVIADLVDQLKTRMVQAQRFAVLVKRLQREGLSRDQIEQITAAGVEGGLATAEAIQSAIDSGQVDIIATLNQTSAAIKAAGTDLGDTLATDYFQAGIKAAQGLVAGLESQAERLDRASAKLARSLVRAIKRALGIKSPSSVFRDIGSQVNQGLALGIGDTYATTASRSLASNVVSAFGSPGLTTSASGSGSHMSVTVTLTAQQVQQLERGRQIQLDLDAYQQAGGRRRA